jgi:DNA-directed RNA polymerase subunit RPC12/RpoP
MRKEGYCIECKRKILDDIEEYIEKYPKENYIQCPNCGKIQGLK